MMYSNSYIVWYVLCRCVAAVAGSMKLADCW